MNAQYVLSSRPYWHPGDSVLGVSSADEMEAKVQKIFADRVAAGLSVDITIYVYRLEATPWLKYTADIAVTGDTFE